MEITLLQKGYFWEFPSSDIPVYLKESHVIEIILKINIKSGKFL